MPDLPTLWVLNCVPLELLHGQQAESLLQAGESPVGCEDALGKLRKLGPKKLAKLYDQWCFAVPGSPGVLHITDPKGEQRAAVSKALRWIEKPDQQIFRLYGPAGSGKTTLGPYIESRSRVNALWLAPTGKAAQNLRAKGLNAQTIHSAIYRPQVDPTTGLVTYNRRTDLDADLMIVDEAPMVGQTVGADLLSFDLPVLAIGDPFQLSPVEEGGSVFATDAPDAELTKIHRAAKGSPIIWAAHRIRRGKNVGPGTYKNDKGSVVVRSPGWLRDRRDRLYHKYSEAQSIILCGTNATRNGINSRVRELRGFSGLPQPGETLICLKNKLPFVNGGLWRVLGCDEPRTVVRTYVTKTGVVRESKWQGLPGEPGKPGTPVELEVVRLYLVSADLPGPPTAVDVPYQSLMFGQPLHWKQVAGLTDFAFGYCLTVHKAQGSEFDNVLLVDEAEAFGQHYQNWRYTGYTRAKKKLVVIC